MLLAAPSVQDDALLWSPIAGRPAVAWSLAALRQVPEIGPIALVVARWRLDDAARLIDVEGITGTGAIPLPPDGQLADVLVPRLPLQVEKGEAEAAHVMVLHDAAQPLLPAGHLTALIAAAVEVGFAVSAVPVKETIKRVADGRVVETLRRDELAQLILPLAVRSDLLGTLLQASGRRSYTHPLEVVTAALEQGVAVRAVALASESLVITTPEDLAVADALLSRLAPG